MRIRFFFITAFGSLLASPSLGDSMPVGRTTSQPIGHYHFCQLNASECSVVPKDLRLLKLTDALWQKITSVNREVNTLIKPQSDLDTYGENEVWAYPTKGYGDCEDYALEKRERLYKMGISLANLLLTVVRKPDGEGHAILTVTTDQGDFVLDNLRENVLPWRDTGYKYLKRQARYYTGRWVSLGPTPTAGYPVAAADR